MKEPQRQASADLVTQFTNCHIIRGHEFIREDLWLRNGKIINPEPLFFDEKKIADQKVDCKGSLIVPGYIDLQINGGFGYDFSDAELSDQEAVDTVAKGILAHGVTAFCPTLITQSRESYHRVLSRLEKRVGGKAKGAAVLGLHLEGPFISLKKKGAHPPEHVRHETLLSAQEVVDFYQTMDNVCIVTMAPELDPTGEVVKGLVNRGVVVSVGHSMGSLTDGEKAVNSGATLMTHLFNAMLPFHHRDPGLVGLLSSSAIDKVIFYGIIADGIHTHYAALKIAHKANPMGLVLVTDAISPMGLPSGRHKIGTQSVEIKDEKAFVAGTETLCGSIATMDQCVRNFVKVTGCSLVEAIECATLHPAQALGISERKGTLNFGADADFLLMDHDLNVIQTFISGECVWDRNGL